MHGLHCAAKGIFTHKKPFFVLRSREGKFFLTSYKPVPNNVPAQCGNFQRRKKNLLPPDQ